MQSTVGDRYTVRSRFYSPGEEFEGCFTTFYQLIVEADEDVVLKDYLLPEWSNLRFFQGSRPSGWMGPHHVSGAAFTATGSSSMSCRFEMPATQMWGIGISPLGWARFFDNDADGVTNILCDGAKHPTFSKFSPLADILSEPGITPDEQFVAIADFMRANMSECRDEAKIIRIHNALIDESNTNVSDLAEASGLGIRTLERVCHRYFGFTPKLLMQRQRFMRSLTTFLLETEKRWTSAMDDQYHDQAQFTREFRSFMGMNPSEYAQLDHPILSAFMEARARVWGSPAQTLDPPPQEHNAVS